MRVLIDTSRLRANGYVMDARTGNIRDAMGWTGPMEGWYESNVQVVARVRAAGGQLRMGEMPDVEDDAKLPVSEPEPEIERELVEQLEVTVEVERGKPVKESVKAKDKEPVKKPQIKTAEDKEELVEPRPAPFKNKDSLGKPCSPGSKPGLGGFKTNAKAAKSGISAIIPPSKKSLTPLV
ncbi:hypothetical protein RhiJN_05038 [Ceratobasidium sp. AG-Ba]|nr:hypothetical protein RhiJN_05038 [Ceratobasidium sp. AG-Ba]